MNNEEKNDMRTKLSTQKEQVEQDKNIEYSQIWQGAVRNVCKTIFHM